MRSTKFCPTCGERLHTYDGFNAHPDGQGELYCKKCDESDGIPTYVDPEQTEEITSPWGYPS